MIQINLKSNSKNEIIDITSLIQKSITINDGFIYIYCPHTTAGLTINENYDSDVKKDVLKSFNDIVKELAFDHIEGNSSAHIKSILTGKHLMLAVENNKLILGTWDGIFFCEYDGPRMRNILIKQQKSN